MLRKLTWGLVGFAVGAYLMGRADHRTRRTWMRRARKVGRRVEQATEQALESSGVKWINETIQSLNPR